MIHTTNYTNTFIEIADDCPLSKAETPPEKKVKTLANLQYEQMVKNPYRYSSDDIVFECYAVKNDISDRELISSLKVSPVSDPPLWPNVTGLAFIIMRIVK